MQERSQSKDRKVFSALAEKLVNLLLGENKPIPPDALERFRKEMEHYGDDKRSRLGP